MRRALGAGLVLLAASLLAAAPAAACATCYGVPDSPMTAGMNNAILTLLLIVGVVQGGFVALFWSLRRRSRQLREQRSRFHLIDGGAR